MIRSIDISEPIVAILARGSSGIINGGIYRESDLIMFLGMILTLTFTIWSLLLGKKHPKFTWLFWVGLIGSIISIGLIAMGYDIHFWTWMTQSFHFGGLFWKWPSWKTLITLLLYIPTSVFLQKLSINLIGGNVWDHVGTDDPTGCTYDLLGIKIPRLGCGNMRLRLVLSIVSLLILFVYENFFKRRKEKT